MNQTFTLVSYYIAKHFNKQLTETYVDDFTPSDSCIQSILNYSKSYSVQKSNHVGFCEVTLN